MPAGERAGGGPRTLRGAITAALGGHPPIELRREEVDRDPRRATWCSPPGRSPRRRCRARLQELLGSDYLYFYDAIAPIVAADSLDLTKLFWQSRYGKGDGDDYLNAPMDEEQYLAFVDALLAAELAAPHDFEKRDVLRGLPADRGAGPPRDRHAALRPDETGGPAAPDGRRPYAVVQLRQEDLAKSQFNLVGFQSRMTGPSRTGCCA